MKRKLYAGLVLAVVLVLLTAAAAAAKLLSHKEVVEQVAVSLALENDDPAKVNGSYTPEQLTELVSALNENGITLEENSRIMQQLRSGQGYYEDETIMEICRQAFGGNFFTWTLEEQDWFSHLMVDIGYYESYESCLPGEDNMTYEEAESYAFMKWKENYGDELEPENRGKYKLGRQFFRDPENDGNASWYFSLDPQDVALGSYHISFEDIDPEGTAFLQADVPDWSQPYTGDQLMMKFYDVYSWATGTWDQSVWKHLHDMMRDAELDREDINYPQYRGYQMTDYPDPEPDEITRDEAIRLAKEALNQNRAVFNSAVLTEYEGKRNWMVGMIILQPEGQKEDPDAGTYIITLDSRSGQAESVRKAGNTSQVFIPETAYQAASEGILQESDYIRIAAEAIQERWPELDPLNEEEFEARDWGGRSKHEINFTSKQISHGNASATVGADGSVTDVTADVEPANGDNLLSRYWAVFGYFGNWDQKIWVQLGQDMQGMEPNELENRILKSSRFPEESSVHTGHEEAQELGIKATGKRSAEVNTCVLVDAEPHPVWIMRILTDEPDDPVIGIDAENGETVFTEKYKTDYTPHYVLYSMPEVWRKMELETLGAPYMAKVAVTHRFGDMWLDFPELDVENPEIYETIQDGLTVRFIGKRKDMKSYEVELDQNGFVLRCEESDTD